MFELNGSSSDDRKTQCALYQIDNLVSPPFRIATLVESGTIEGQIGEGCRGGTEVKNLHRQASLFTNDNSGKVLVFQGELLWRIGLKERENFTVTAVFS